MLKPARKLEAALRPLLLITVALLALPLRAASADGFSPQQRDEIVRIVRDALKADPSILRDAVAALQADDAKRQEGVSRETLAALAPKLIDPADPVAGNPFAKTTIVEFYDTRCPYCRSMLPTIATLLQTDPNVRIVYKDWPILGAASTLESRALLAAQRQGGYFKLRDAIMKGPPQTSRDSVRELADSLGLDGMRMLRDMDDPVIKARLDATMDLARQLGLQGTPALIVGQQTDRRRRRAERAAAGGRPGARREIGRRARRLFRPRRVTEVTLGLARDD